LSATLAGYGVCQIVDENMAAAARAHAVEWGGECAGRTLVAYGGAAPLHAAALADKLKIDRIVVPGGAGVGSAIGFLLAPISYEVVRSRYLRLSAFDPATANEVMADMRAEAAAVVESAAPEGGVREVRRAYMRYVGQGYEIAVTVPDGELRESAARSLREAFDAEYQRLYGRLIPDLDVEVLSWTLSLIAREADPPETRPSPARREVRPERPCEVFAAARETLVTAGLYLRDALAPGDCGRGPALVVEDQTTTVVGADFDFHLDPWGNLVLERRKKPQDHGNGQGGAA
jgi:N-methylhydantoinase A